MRTLRVLTIALMFTGLAAHAKPAAEHVEIPALQARAEILIDRWGVPHIYAASRRDAFLVQGWNAARDRLWQIDLWRRSGLGELAAALGPRYVEQDRAIRLLVYRGDMAREWAAYGAEARDDAEAFVAGINAYVTAVRAGSQPLPLEFKIGGYQPALWQAVDVVRVRNHGLSIGAEFEALRAQMACKTRDAAAAAALPYGVSPPWNPVVPEGLDWCSIPANVLEVYQLGQKRVSFDSAPAAGSARDLGSAPDGADDEARRRLQGSNNWVISPKRSATGRPILANDPHRSLAIPSLRYIAHLSAPGLDVIGAGEPALPGVSIGHNDHIAFGITVFPIAQEDLYVYDTNPDDPDQYGFKGAYEPMRHVSERIAVRGSGDVSVDLKFTRHGPVVFEDPARHRAYAVRATWLETGGAPYFASMRYLDARNEREFAAALEHWGEPGENHIFADTSGHIAWYPAGFVPLRSNTDGLLPLPGDGRYEWAGLLARTALPSASDPERGFIATANQMNLPPDYPYRERRVGFTWFDDTRYRRIAAVLGATAHGSLSDSTRLQNDTQSLPARRLIMALGKTAGRSADLDEAIRWLGDWDFRIDAGSARAALYEIWVAHHLTPAAAAKMAPQAPPDLRGLIEAPAVADFIERSGGPGGAGKEQTDALLLSTLEGALREAREKLGEDRNSWQWGRLGMIEFRHPMAALAPPGSPALSVGPAPKAGDGSTVGVASYRESDFRVTDGASFRMVLDVGQWDRSLAVNTPGQSGDPASAHYADLFPLWLNGRYFPLAYSRAAVEAATERRIALEP